MFQCIVQPRTEFGQIFNDMKDVKGVFTEIRNQFEDHLECLDTRLEQQKQELSNIQDFFKKRAEIEKRYSKELDGLSKSLYNKHKDVLKDPSATSSSAILKELIKETQKTSKYHSAVEDVFGSEIYGSCQKLSADISRVYRQCKEAVGEVQENVLGTLFELHTKNKIYQTNKDNFELAQKKLGDAEKEIAKLEKEIKPEKREKTRKYVNAEKQLKTRQIRHEDTYNLATQSQMEYILCTEGANAAMKKYYKEDLSDMMDCMDLGFHHLLKNIMKMRTSAIENLIMSGQEDAEVMDMALASLDARKDKLRFLENHPHVFSQPAIFELKTSKSLQSNPEEMDLLKRKIQERIVKLRDLSAYTAKVIEDSEAELLQMFNAKDFDVKRYFVQEKDTEKQDNSHDDNTRHSLEELIIENNKRLITTNNKIEQEEAKYQNLKNSLVVQQFCSETLPRPNMKKKKSKMQTIGLPKIFGGSLDEYFEATGEMIPLVIESSIRTINLFGMKHQGIFRVTGSHIDIKQFKDAFENGEDPFACMTDGNQINSVSGVLKSYFRKLTEPLFSETYFDQFMNITRNSAPPHVISVKEKRSKNIGENVEFVEKARQVVQQWTEPHIAVTRYLFAFLNDLSQYSDETQMDPYNLAICFGPNLCPIPDGKDLVQHTNLVNDLIKNFIIFCDDIFNFDIDAPVYSDVERSKHYEEELELCIPEKTFDEEAVTNLPKEAVAIFDYQGASEKEISFKKDDKLILYSKASEHWWKGSKAGVAGLVAAQYVRLITGSDTDMEPAKEMLGREDITKKREDELMAQLLLEEDPKSVVTKTLSFKSNRNMWESFEKEKAEAMRSRTLEQPKRKPNSNQVVAPDLLQDLLERRAERSERKNAGMDLPDGIDQNKNDTELEL